MRMCVGVAVPTKRIGMECVECEGDEEGAEAGLRQNTARCHIWTLKGSVALETGVNNGSHSLRYYMYS